MKASQLDFIYKKMKERISEYENGLRKYPPHCYTDPYPGLPIKLIKEVVSQFLNNFDIQFDIVTTFYRTHKEEPSTEKECERGVDFLKARGVCKSMIDWFIESYSFGLPEKEKIREIEYENNYTHSNDGPNFDR